MLVDRLKVKYGQRPLREVPGETWWPHKLQPNSAPSAPLRNTATHCARLKKRISRWEKGFPLWNPFGQQAKLCLIIQSLFELCRAEPSHWALLFLPPLSPPLDNCPIFYTCRHSRRLSKNSGEMMPGRREPLTFECMQRCELWLYEMDIAKKP